MKRTGLLLALLSMILVPSFAQDGAVAVLEYADDLSEVDVLDRDEFRVEIFLGIGLSPGDRIITGESAAELRLEPNGSIIKIAPDTTFVVDSIQGHREARDTRTTLRSGRVRFVAARSRTRELVYSMHTPGAVLGVRGTDFAAAVTPGEEGERPLEEAFVFSGAVIATDRASEEEAFVSAGEGITIDDGPFLPETWGEERLNAFRAPLEFTQLNPADVPSPETEVAEEEETPEPEDPDDVPPPVTPEATPEPPDPEPGFLDRAFGRLAEATGLTVGSVTIDGQTFGQVAFQPHITVGDLQLALYFPITYRSNIFDPDDWYKPGGNNEWSFGTDQDWSDDPEGAIWDVVTDVALKIRYLQYRDQGDPFFVKIGNVSNFTIGQGLLMRNYANDTEFPAIRRLGVNLGVDFEEWGFESIVNDLLDPDIYGGRLYFRPALPVIPAAVGISGVTDLRPASVITRTAADDNPLLAAAREGDPLFLNLATDLEVPVIRRDLFAIIGFAEAGVLLPYVQESTELDGTAVSSGLKTNAIVDFQSGNLKNYGWTTGVRGNALMFDYRLAYQFYDGTFRPGFYGPSYDRIRGTYAGETVRYLANWDAEEYNTTNMGVAGEIGATLFDDALYLGAGYLWPWEITDSGSWKTTPEDEFELSARVRENVLPFGIGGGIQYRRRFFAASVGGWSGYSADDLFDANTTLTGYLAYPVTDLVSIVARVSTTTQRDQDGEIVYDDQGQPKMAPTVVIQTEIGL